MLYTTLVNSAFRMRLLASLGGYGERYIPPSSRSE